MYFALPRGGLAQAIVFLVMFVAATVLVAMRLHREALLRTGPWTFLLAGAVAYATATLFWSLFPVVAGRPLPFPSPVDAAYFTSYGLYAAFLIGVLRRQEPSDPQNDAKAALLGVVDAGIFACAVMAVLWPGVIAPNIEADVARLTLLTAVAYPVTTAILCGLALRVVVLGRARGGAELLLGVWIGGELAADIFYGYLSASGTFFYGHPISVGWLVSYSALAALALHPICVG